MLGALQRTLTVLVLCTCLVHLSNAHSLARNPLNRIGIVRDAVIHKTSRRVTAFSSFDLSLDIEDRRVHLSLEPDHDVLAEGASIQYLGDDGTIERTAPIVRVDHKIYKGRARIQNPKNGKWMDVGWARMMVDRDGDEPIFSGAFTAMGIAHHIMLSSEYTETRHELDPVVESAGEDFMVVFRDTDIATEQEHMQLREKRGLQKEVIKPQLTCRSGALMFNQDPNHPISRPRHRKRHDQFWTPKTFSRLFSRQIDNPSGHGNSAGVDLAANIGSTQGCPTTRKVALVGVATDCTYLSTFPNEESMRRYIIRTIARASNVYEDTFNFSLAIQNLTISRGACPGEQQAATPWNLDCSDSVNIQDRLDLFSGWRGQQQDTNSHWTLFTRCGTGSAVGLAWLGQACNQGSTTSPIPGGGNETVAGANVVVRTSTEWQVVAHETGHTYDAVHDCTAETCSDGTTVETQQCCPFSTSSCDAQEMFIMNPSTAQGVTQFSQCSIGNICSAMYRHNVHATCLRDNNNIKTITEQVCGNGIVEDGEDCDCGGTEGCTGNQCCDPQTCKFVDGAVCDDANQDCCSSCQLASANTVCRPSTSDCDPQEVCTGSSASCPRDQTLPDGDDCGDGLQCASGQCTSRDQQCRIGMSGYAQGTNDTTACDDNSCQLTCRSPDVGTGVCFGLQQNFLDGTPCGASGSCRNGQCEGSSFGDEASLWIHEHLGLVIGISAGAGGLIVILILICCIRRCRRRRRQPKQPQPPPGMVYGRQQGRHRSPVMTTPFTHHPNNNYQNSSSTQLFGARGPNPNQSSSNEWGTGIPDHHYATPDPVYRGPSVRYA